MYKNLKKRIAVLLSVSMILTAQNFCFVPGSGSSFRRMTAHAEEDTASESDLADGPVGSTATYSDETFALDETVTVDGTSIHVTADAGVFPEGCTVSAAKVQSAEDTQNISEAVEKKVKEQDEKASVRNTLAFDIRVLDRNGNELQPDTSKGNVQVQFSQVDMELVKEDPKAELQVFHMNDAAETSAEKLAANVDREKETVKVDAEHFSIYIIGYVISDDAATYSYTGFVRDGGPTILTADMVSEYLEVNASSPLKIQNFIKSSDPTVVAVTSNDTTSLTIYKPGTADVTCSDGTAEYKIHFMIADPALSGKMSGKCGDNLNFEISIADDLTTGTLSITGSGPMYDYEYGEAPWFFAKNYIKNLSLGSGITYIGANAFHSLSLSDSTVTIPSGVTELGSRSFAGTNMTGLVLPDTLTKVDYASFNMCNNLGNYTIPSSVTEVGFFAFRKTAFPDADTSETKNVITNQSQVNLVPPITHNSYYFHYNPTYSTISGNTAGDTEAPVMTGATTDGKLVEGYLYVNPQATDNIAVYKYACLVKTQGAAAPTSAELTAWTAWYSQSNCRAFRTTDSALLQAGNTYDIYVYAKDYYGNISVPVKLTATLTKYDTTSGYCGLNGGTNISWTYTTVGTANSGNYSAVITLKGSGEMENYTSAADTPWYLFTKSAPYANVVFDSEDSGITSIGNHAFDHCRLGTDLEIASSTNSTSPSTLDLPDTLTKIGDYAFANNDFQTDLFIPEGVTEIGEGAFYDFTKGQEEISEEQADAGYLELNEGLKSIGKDAFKDDCFKGSLELPSTLVSIGEDAFRQENINYEQGFTGPLSIPASVQSIGSGAFRNFDTSNGNLSFLSPSSLTDIGAYAFADTKLIGGVNFPDSIRTIGANAFLKSNDVGDIVISSGCTSIGDAAFYKSALGTLGINHIRNLSGVSLAPEGFYNALYTDLITDKTIISDGDVAFASGDPLYTDPDTKRPLTPEIAVTVNGVSLTEGTDYEVEYSNNVLPGDAVATVRGIGTYIGTVSKSFVIHKLEPTLATSSMAIMYDPDLTVGDLSLENFENGTYPSGTFTWELPKTLVGDAGTHYFKAVYRPNTTDAKYYASKIVEIEVDVSIAEFDGIDFSLSKTQFDYTGSEIQPEVTNDRGLVKDKDYTVTYANNTNAGEATVTITGIGNYKATENVVTLHFTIGDVLTEDGVTINDSCTYNGTQQKPTVTVTAGGHSLASGSDYTVAYGENINAGTDAGSVTITGQGTTYAGQVITKHFSIEQAVPIVKAPSAITATYGQTLSEIDLASWSNADGNGTFAWVTPGENVGNVGTNAHKLRYTPNNSNYMTITSDYGVQVIAKQLSADDFTVSPSSSVYTGSPASVLLTNSDGTTLIDGTDYSSAFPVDMTSAGVKEISIEGKGNYSGEIKKSFEITRAALADATVTLSPDSSVFNDSSINAIVTVTIPAGNGLTFTVPNTEYEVTYGQLADHKVPLTITAKNGANISGSVVRYYTVNPMDIKNAQFNFSSKYEYTGAAIEPSLSDFTVTLDMVTGVKKTLASASDYEITSYADNTAAGTGASVTITGKGNFTGTAVGYFTILPDSHDLSGATITFTSSAQQQFYYAYGHNVSPAVTVTDTNNRTLDSTDDYELTYENCINAGTATLTVSGKGTYHGSKVITYTVQPRPLNETSVATSLSAYSYTGAPIIPALVIYPGNSMPTVNLVNGTDYDVTAGQYTNAGTATVSITGKGNYSSSCTVPFTINKADISNAVINLQSNQYEYTGAAVTPAVDSVVSGSITLPQSDYTVSYSNNTAAGTATVTVTGTGNCLGSCSKNFDIVSAQLAEGDVQVTGTYTYNGSQQIPAETDVKVRHNGTDLASGSDYSVAYGENINAGTGTVTVSGKGNYTGTIQAAFNIAKASINGGSVTLTGADSLTYNGSAQKPTRVEVLADSRLLTEGTDYDLSYTNNVNAGTATVKVTGKGNYGGEASKTYIIQRKSLNDAYIIVEAAEYTGSELYPKVTVIEFNNQPALKEGTDYTLSYTSNINVAGEHDVTVTGIGNYKDSPGHGFKITPAALSAGDVAVSGAYTYSGSQQTPGTGSVSVTHNGRTLTAGTDYETAFTYGANINAGTGTVTVTGKGNYKGTSAGSFTIGQAVPSYSVPAGLKATYSDALSSVKFADAHFRWEDGTQKVGNRGTNTFKADYTPDSANYSKVTGIEVPVSVSARELTAADLSLSVTAYTYTGNAAEPAVTAAAGLSAADYTVTYRNNVNAGTGTAVITGRGNLSGTVEKTFAIAKAAPVLKAAAGNDIRKTNGSADFSLGVTSGGTGAVTYTSSDPSVLTVDGNGTVKVLSTGSAFVTVASAEDSNYKAAALQIHITVTSSGGSGSSGGGGGGGSTPTGGTANTPITIVPQNYGGGTQQIGNYIVPDTVEQGGWSQKTDGSWGFTTSGGENVADKWIEISIPNANVAAGETPYAWYKFDANGNMQTGFVTDAAGNTFYLDETKGAKEGEMAVGWKQIGDKWYYFDEHSGAPLGKMLKGTRTPDGYTLNADGSWDGNPKQS